GYEHAGHRLPSTRGAHRAPSDGEVRETLLAHRLGLVEVPAVEDHGAAEELLHAAEVRPPELVQLRYDEQRIRLLEHIVVRAVIGHRLTEVLARLAERFWFVDRNRRTLCHVACV